MSNTCTVQTLLNDGACFSLACLTRDQQVVAELQLLAKWAGWTGTIQSLLNDGSCFSLACLSTQNAQVMSELQLYCQISGGT